MAFANTGIKDHSAYGKDADPKIIEEMLSDDRFSRAMQRTRKAEGGYTNSDKDRGKETKYGITSRWYPKENIKDLTRERADYILYRDYWKNSKINTLDDNVSEGVKPDGYIGEETLRALKKMDNKKLIESFKNNVENRYEEIKIKYPKNQKYSRGWSHRKDSY